MSVYMTMAIRWQGQWIAWWGWCAEPHSQVPYLVQVVHTVAFHMEATGGRCITRTPDSELGNWTPIMRYVATVSNLVAGAGVTVKTLATRLRVGE